MPLSPKAAVIALALSAVAIATAGADPVAPTGSPGESPWTLLSPWTLSRSGYFLQTTTSYLSTSEAYDINGFKQSTLSYKELTTNLHLEYGLRNSIGLFLHVPVRNMKQELPAPPDAVEWGISDLTTGVRWRVFTDPVVASLQGEIKFPTGYNYPVQQLPLGEGQLDYTIRGLVGHSFPEIHGYVSGAGGYRYRTGYTADQVVFNADGGAWVFAKVMAEAHWEYEKHKGQGNLADRTQGGISARWRNWRRFDLLGGVFHTFGGQNVQAGTQVFLGFSYRGNRLSRIQGPMSSNLSDTPLPEPPKKKAPVHTAPAAPAADTTQVKIIIPPPAAPESPAMPDTTKKP